MIPVPDRIQGSLVGLAVGDALGAAVEFQAPGSFTPVTGFRGGGPFRLKPGEWTDDTSLALCLAESLIECRGFSATDQLDRYCAWYHKGHLSCTGVCFDIGSNTRQALAQYEKTRQPDYRLVEHRPAGNGSLMRVAPVPLVFSSNPAEAILLSAENSKTTHAHPVCVDACRYYGALITGAVRGEPKEVLLAPMYTPVGDFWDSDPFSSEIAEVAKGSFKVRNPPEIRGKGYVRDALEAALWAFYTTDTFREGCLAAVNLGDDADTTGAIYGQLAGAYYGIGGIPQEWVEGLAKREMILEFADGLNRLREEISPN